MYSTSRSMAAAVAVLIGSATMAADASEVLTVALIHPQMQDADAPPLLETVLFTALSDRDDVRMVERERVRALLAEQALGLSGAIDRRAVAKAGRVVAADFFVYLEHVRESPARDAPSLVRMRVVETRSGVVLHEYVNDEAVLEDDPGLLIDAFEAAHAAARVEPGARRYLSVLSVRSEDLLPSVDAQAEALAMFLRHDLGKIPEVVVLEREDMGALLQERALTGLDHRLKASALLLEAGLKRVDADRLDLTLRLASVTGADAVTKVVKVPADDIHTLRRRAIETMAALLEAAPPKVVGDASEEAKRFERRHAWHRALEEYREAVTAAEAAHALDPSYEAKLRLHHALRNWMNRELRLGRNSPRDRRERHRLLRAGRALRRSAGDEIDKQTRRELREIHRTAMRLLFHRRRSREERRKAILAQRQKTALRLVESYPALVSSYLALRRADIETVRPPVHVKPGSSAEPPWHRPNEDKPPTETERRLMEVMPAYVDALRRLVNHEFQQQRGVGYANKLYALLEVEAVIHDDKTRLAHVKKYIQQCEHAIESGWFPWLRVFHHRWFDRATFDDPAEADALAEWMIGRDVPIIRMHGWSILMQNATRRLDSAEQIVRHFVLEHEHILGSGGGSGRLPLLDETLELIRQDRTRWDERIEPVLIGAIAQSSAENGDMDGVVSIVSYTLHQWVDFETGEGAAQVQAMLNRSLPAEYELMRRSLAPHLDYLIDSKVDESSAGLWATLAMRRVELGDPPEATRRIVGVAIDEQARLVVCWDNRVASHEQRDDGQTQTRWSWDGPPRMAIERIASNGDRTQLWSGALPDEHTASAAAQQLGLVMDGDTVVIVRYLHNAIMVIRDGRMRVRGIAHGVPMGTLGKVVTLHGRFYITGSTPERLPILFRYDPETDHIQLLRSSRSVRQSSILDQYPGLIATDMVVEPEANRIRMRMRNRRRQMGRLAQTWVIEVAPPEAEEPWAKPRIYKDTETGLRFWFGRNPRGLGPYRLDAWGCLRLAGHPWSRCAYPPPIEGWTVNEGRRRARRHSGQPRLGVGIVGRVGPGWLLCDQEGRGLIVAAMPEEIDDVDLPLGADPRE